MEYEDFIKFINYLKDSGNLSFDILEQQSGYENISLLIYLRKYIDYLLINLEDYVNLIIIIPIFLEGLQKYDEINNYKQYLYDLYSELQFRARKIYKNSDDTKMLKRLRICRKMIKDFINEKAIDNRNDAEEAKKFEYAWTILTEIRYPEFFRLLIRKRCYYVNITDASYNSLFLRLALEYLENYDEYYLRVLPIILENPNFLLEKEEIEKIYSELDKHYRFKLNTKQPLDRLKKLLDHYFLYEQQEWILRNSITSMKESVPRQENRPSIILDRIDTIDRVNLTALKTFSLYTSTRGSIKAKYFNTTSAYSIIETHDGYELYYHIPDLPEYIKEDSPENERALHLIEAVKYKNRIVPLFDEMTLKTYTTFLPGFERLAITFRIKLDHKFRITALEVFKSVVKNDNVFMNSEVPESLEEKGYRELALLARITDALKNESLFYKNRAHEIQQTISTFINCSLASLENGNLPFVYKNLIDHDNTESILKYSRLTEYTNKFWSSKEARQYLSIYKGAPLRVTLYSPQAMIAIPSCQVMARVTEPHMSFVALENLRMLKDLVIEKKPLKSEWKERALHTSFIANSANSELYVEDPEVKRLLLYRNNCDKIDI